MLNGLLIWTYPVSILDHGLLSNHRLKSFNASLNQNFTTFICLIYIVKLQFYFL